MESVHRSWHERVGTLHCRRTNALTQRGWKALFLRRCGGHAANAVTLARVVLAIIVVTAAQFHFNEASLLLPVLIVLVFALDGIDGSIARWLNSASILGSFLDLAADRIVEFLFILLFTLNKAIPAWFPIIFYARIILSDSCRFYAYRTGRVAASGIELPSYVSQVVLHPISRTAYGTIKMAVFLFLFISNFTRPQLLDISWYSRVVFCGLVTTIALSLFRGFPIILRYGLGLARWWLSGRAA